MKTCAYCGKENSDDAISCRECGTNEFKSSLPANPPPEPVSPPDSTAPQAEFPPVKLEFMTPTPKQMEMDLVTLLRCRTLVDADLIVAQLESAGIDAFIPDEFLMQAISFNLNTYGYVRIQVAPKDYEEAKEFLSAGASPAGSPST
jgi:hypothetical protein